MSLSTVRGITWNHSRAFPPLIATAQRFGELHPAIEVTWEKRSLHEFGHASLANLCAQYDLIIVDHPMMGEAHRDNLLLDLKPLLKPEVLTEMAEDSLGESYRSYLLEDHLYALPIDAAAPAASSRTDLMARFDIAVPGSWEQMLSLARRGLVRMPGFPADLFLNFVGMCLSQGAVLARSSEELLDREIALSCFELLHELASYMPAEIFNWNPITLYEEMVATDDFVYCPFAYTYSNYSRPGFAKHNLRFGSSPPLPSRVPMRTVLGGTGIALSRLCKQQEPALAFAEYVQSATCQGSLYGQAGGQPARRSAWADPTLNAISGDFFSHTLASIDLAYVRPRYAGYIPFQEQAGVPLAEYIQVHRGGGSRQAAQQALDRVDKLYRSSFWGPRND